MSKLTLSVILPNYNHGKYLPAMMDSILSQTLQPEQIVVIDDASTDQSVEILEYYAERYKNITFLKNDINRGAGLSVERGIETATGDFIAFLSADDMVLPGFFEESMKILQEFPNAGLCTSDAAYIHGDSQSLSVKPHGWLRETGFIDRKHLADIINGDFISGHASLLRRRAVEEAGGMLPELKWHLDWFTIHVIAFRYGICYIPKPLSALRILSNSYSSSRSKPEQDYIMKQVVCQLFSERYRDVLPFFKKGNILRHFGIQFVQLFACTPELWTNDCAELLEHFEI